MLAHIESLVHIRVSGRPIAVTRIMLGAALAIMTLESVAALAGVGAGRLAYPYHPMMPVPPSWMSTVILFIGLLSAVTLLLGLLPHVMAALGCISCLATLAADQQTYSNHLVLLTALLALLAFSESDRRWGLSSGRHDDGSTSPYWTQLLMMAQVSTCYFFAGLSKVQPTFLSGEPLAGWMWLSLPIWAFAGLAWLTVLTEVGLAVMLWAPRLRVLATVAGVSLHLSIIVFLTDQTLALVAFGLTTLSVYPLFLSRPNHNPEVTEGSSTRALAAERWSIRGRGARVRP